MIIWILVFIFFNLYYYLDKSMSGLRHWVLKNMNPTLRQDMKVCLSYIHLDWLIFTSYKSKK